MDEARPITIGLLGCGTVGGGVVRLLQEHAEDLAARVGAPLHLGPVAVRDPSKEREVAVAELTDDPARVVGGDDVDLVVEVIGGLDPAGGLIADALRGGRGVVTANKELISTRGPELSALAADHGAGLEFEAAVAGGIPIIKPLRESLAGDRVRRVTGILNGTTNYVLTRMTEAGLGYDEALEEAVRLGYAEPDPTADVDGSDAAAKTAIVAALAFDADVVADQVHREGIAGVSSADIATASRMGYVIKLLSVAEEVGGRIGVRVHPAMVPREHPLASVRESFNAVFIEADAAGELMFYGRGAGALPTASAIVGDLVTLARRLRAGERAGAGEAGRAVRPLRDFAETTTQYAVRVRVADAPGVLAAVAGVFAEHGVSIQSVWQEGTGEEAQLVLITHMAVERGVQATLDGLRDLDAVREVASLLRVQGEQA